MSGPSQGSGGPQAVSFSVLKWLSSLSGCAFLDPLLELISRETFVLGGSPKKDTPTMHRITGCLMYDRWELHDSSPIPRRTPPGRTRRWSSCSPGESPEGREGMRSGEDKLTKKKARRRTPTGTGGQTVGRDARQQQFHLKPQKTNAGLEKNADFGDKTPISRKQRRHIKQ